MLQTAWERVQSSAALHDSPLTCSASGLFYCIHVVEHALSMSCVFMHLGAATEMGEVPYSSQPLVPFPKFQWRLLAQCKFDVSFRPGCSHQCKGQVPMWWEGAGPREESPSDPGPLLGTVYRGVGVRRGPGAYCVVTNRHRPISTFRDSAWCLHGVMTSCHHWPDRVLISDLMVKSSGSYYWPVQPATTFLYLILKMILGF